MNDSLLLYASWAFFAVLTVIVAALSVDAFGRDVRVFLGRHSTPASSKNPADTQREFIAHRTHCRLSRN